MLIVGAGGLAAQIFPDIEAMYLPDISFWSEVETRYSFIREKFPVLSNDSEVKQYFRSITKTFILCVGTPSARRSMATKFKELGGSLATYISPFSTISKYSVAERGATILSNVIIESGVAIEEGCLLNKTSNVGHGCTIGAFSELAPGVILAGEVTLGENCYIGTGSIILPRVKIGNNVSIAAGAVVRKNVPANSIVAGPTTTVLRRRKTS